ncbi:hypothetical protein WMF45_50055 [Sorangium sp. So ce448]|uniref:hypothetical protein n=1 Tax=Sorangium sp. So ce448 TaxID=3133314 RepID=UPI003F63827D
MNPSSFLSLGVALALTLGACGPGENGDATGGTGGGGASGGTVGSGSQSSAGGAGGTPQEASSASSGGASGGATSTGGAGPSGGTSSGGGSGAATGGTSASGGAPGGDCTRELLDGLLDDYFAALAAGDPSSLPLAEGVKFTENGKQAEIGATDFWRDAGEVKHSQRALDTEACSAGAQAVIPEGGRDLPVALRIKVEGSELTEIETIVVRPGDYTASFAVASNPAAIIAISDEIGWHDEVPEAERATREELTSWIDKYFRAFPSGVCDVTGACKRLENGGGNFSCRTGASCSAGDPGSGGTFIPRVILADEVRGIAIGLTIFDFMTDGHLDMHMIKMSGGQVHAVHAILRDTNGVSGWE